DTDLCRRILGTYPGTTGPRFDRFVARYTSTYPDLPKPDTYAAGTYDAVYILAYAAASLGAQPITGPSIVSGIGKLVPPGKAIDVGTEQMSVALQELQAGRAIDLAGASGPLNFDLQTGDVESDIQVWCIGADGSGNAAALSNSGLYYSADSETL